MQRPVLLTGVALTGLLPLAVAALLSTESARYGIGDVVSSLRTVLAAAWPLLAVAAGAITFATEAEDGTAKFLLSRPVSRMRLWCLKVGAAAAALAAVGILALGLVRALVALTGSPDVEYVVRFSYSDLTLFTPATVLAGGLLFFACGVLCSTVVGRPLTAAAAAVAVGLALAAVVFTAWSAVGLAPQLEPQWLAIEVIAVAAALLAASLLIFIRPEQLVVHAALRSSGRTAIAGSVVLSLAVAALPVVFMAMTPGIDDLSVVPGSVSHSGQAVAMAMRTADGTTQNWLLMVDGSGARPLTGRHTLAPMWGAGRDLIAYYSRRGPLGSEGDALDLRVTDLPGTMSWTAMRGIPAGPQLFFSGEGRAGKVAFATGSGIVVADLSGNRQQTIPRPGSPADDAKLLGFRVPRRSRLMFATGALDASTTTLRADGALVLYVLDDGRLHELVELGAGSVLPARLRNPEPSAQDVRGGPAWIDHQMPVLSIVPSGPTGATGRLLRVRGETVDPSVVHEIGPVWIDEAGREAFYRCAAIEEAPSRRWQTDERPPRNYSEPQILFGDCGITAREQFPAGAIRLVGDSTGNTVSWPLPADWRGRIHRIHLSQDQRTVLLDIRAGGAADDHAITLTLNGDVHRYPAGWTPLGWTSLDYFLLQREQDGGVTFAVGDTRNGEIYDLFPNNELREVLERRRLEQEAIADSETARARLGGADTDRSFSSRGTGGAELQPGARDSKEMPKP